MVRYLTREEQAAAYARRPVVDDSDPATLVPAAVASVMDVAETWLGWDGRPVYRDGNVWSPHKALRRVADHLLDHLAEIECRLAGRPTLPDRWHGRMLTLSADFATFTEADLDEAGSRLSRLAACYAARLGTLDGTCLDVREAATDWTIREVVHHAAGVSEYASMLGRLVP